jgi:hypothetical protein
MHCGWQQCPINGPAYVDAARQNKAARVKLNKRFMRWTPSFVLALGAARRRCRFLLNHPAAVLFHRTGLFSPSVHFALPGNYEEYDFASAMLVRQFLQGRQSLFDAHFRYFRLPQR